MISGAIKSVIGVLFLIFMVLAIGYVAACTIGNVQAFSGNEYHAPDEQEANYSVRIRNTGNVLFTDNIKREGELLFIKGFWELDKRGKKFVYRDMELTLDMEIFGPVEVKQR